VLRAADGTRTGSITGRVASNGLPVADASLRLYLGNSSQPENTWSVLSTAHTTDTGQFTFAFVTRSAHWEEVPAQQGNSYIVTVDPPLALEVQRALVSHAQVSAGQAADLGTIALP